MTVPSHFHMPGAFHDQGIHPVFRPPMSPSSSSSYGYAAPRTTTPLDASVHAKRKRNDMSRSQDVWPDDDLDRSSYFGTPVQQARHHDRRYQLAGQLDTPSGGAADSGILGESMYSDSDYRRALGSKRSYQEDERSAIGPTPLFNLPPQPAPSQGWGSFAFSTIGGMVGRVLEFCKIGAFRGFQAGGGTGFKMTSVGIEEIPSSMDERPVDCHHVPGRFPSQTSGYFGEHPEQSGGTFNSGASTPTKPAAKRRQTDERDELGRNWVVVSDSDPAGSRAPTPQSSRRSSYRPTPRSRNQGPSMATRRRISSPALRLASTPASGHHRQASRPSSRLSHAPSPPLPSPRLASTASFAPLASPRSPSPSKIPQPSSHRRDSIISPTRGSIAHRRDTITSPTRGSISHRRSTITSPSSGPSGIGHRRTHSSASTASARVSVENSPRLGVEAKHLAARRKAEERDTDVRISTFNKQLQDMIRQGKEALGTTIEVEGNWEDDV